MLVENIHQHTHTGDLVALQVDPRKPTRVRDPESWHWHPFDITPIALAAAIVAWAHLNRAIRHRRAAA